MREPLSIGDAIDRLILEAEQHDPTRSVPVYDLERLQPKDAARWALVDGRWLDDLWHELHPGELIPHTHIGDL